MPGQPTKRRNYWTPLLVFSLLIVGIFIGFQLNKHLDHKRPITTIIERNDRIEEIINLINERYVDTIDKNQLYDDAITGVLKHLDPHTSYIPASEMGRISEGLEGNFKGIGVEFFILRDTILISSVIKNGPAEDAGLQVGDQIIRVDSQLVAGNGVDNEKIIKLLRGIEDSKVNLTINRKYKDSTFVSTVKRGLVPLYSVDAVYMIDKKTGYIRINRFSATTYREFMKGLDALLEKGMSQLILDLRQNPGGYLDAATAIADEIISNDKLLVYTEGRMMPKEDITAQKEGVFEDGKIVVLVDEGSASASEIIAGAIQDWDRGVVVGRRTYGKGLVQEQYKLTDGSALRLTVARYFTPTGRNIQRPYDNGKDIYQTEHRNRYSLEFIDSLNSKQDTAKYYTGKHRVVHGGGGISPDVFVPLDHTIYSEPLYDLIVSRLMSATVYDYFLNHHTQLSKYKNIKAFNTRFTISQDLVNVLKANFEEEYPNQVKEIWADRQAYDYLILRMRALLAKMLFGENGYYQVINSKDKIVERALRIINTSEYSGIIRGDGP